MLRCGRREARNVQEVRELQCSAAVACTRSLCSECAGEKIHSLCGKVAQERGFCMWLHA